MRKYVLLSLALMALCVPHRAAGEPGSPLSGENGRLMTSMLTAAAPQIDGNLNDPVWQAVPEETGFTRLAAGNAPTAFPTFVRSLFDKDNLYFSFRCLQPRDTLKAVATPDGPVWDDDCVEVFLTPHMWSAEFRTLFPEEQHFHFIFNSAGTRFDELGNRGAASWNGDWEVRTSIADDEWRAEMRIPFNTFYGDRGAPVALVNWGMQIARTSVLGGEYSTWSPSLGTYREHRGFGNLVFITEPQGATAIKWSLDRQNLVQPALKRMRTALAQLRLPAGSQESRDLQARQRSLDSYEQKFAAADKSRYSPEVQAAFAAELETVRDEVRSFQENLVQAKAREEGNRAGIAVAPHPPVIDRLLVKPDFLPPLETIGKPVKVAVTPEEYGAASFVLWTGKPLRDVTVRLGALKAGAAGRGQVLPPESVDVRWVKVWYQAGESEVYRGPKILTPELLLKNPDLVTVDLEKQENVLLPYRREGYYNVHSYPGDSEELLPQKKIEGRTATQVWLTVSVPGTAAPDIYRGDVQVLAGNQLIATLPIEIEVLDFTLAPSMMEHNWYAETGWGQIDVPWQNPERALAEIRNMARHGATHVGLTENRNDLQRAIALMKQGGLNTDRIYVIFFGEHNHPAYFTPEQAEAEAAAWVKEAREAGAKELYLYLKDEARGERLRAQRPQAEAMRRAGAKTWVAGGSDYFDDAGDFIDLTNQAGPMVSPELVKKVHAAGHRIFSYANPQSSMERPETYRRNYGLLLWQNDYDGAFPWHYYATFGSTVLERNPWEEFLDPMYRQCVMVYPTRTGVVDTIQWEGWREGVNDCKYMATLLREIESAKKEGRAGAAVRSAEAWAAALKAGGRESLADLDAVRAAMISHIKACRAARKP